MGIGADEGTAESKKGAMGIGPALVAHSQVNVRSPIREHSKGGISVVHVVLESWNNVRHEERLNPILTSPRATSSPREVTVDASRFDALARAFSETETRRRLIGIPVFLLGWLGPDSLASDDDVEAQPRRRKQHQRRAGSSPRCARRKEKEQEEEQEGEREGQRGSTPSDRSSGHRAARRCPSDGLHP